ncbi:uncharacterized protein LOC144152078 [Haemaphysalis longicornis]
MRSLGVIAVLSAWSTIVVLGKLGAPGGPLQFPQQDVDAFKAVEGFPSSVAISDWDNDTVFECLKAFRTEMNSEARTATMVWELPPTEDSPGQLLPLHLSVGDEPDVLSFTVDEDTTPMEARIYYTDYSQCVVMDIEYPNHRCLMWTTRELKDNVPQECIDHFVDTCGVVPPAHSRDLCPDGEGDY